MNEATNLDIRIELVLRAPRQKVWEALVTNDGWGNWFGERVFGDFQVGSTLEMDFGSHGLCWGIVTERKEASEFAYKWHPGEDCPIDKYPESEMTEVRFTLADCPDGTTLTMVESGFENVPEERRAKCFELNTGGWNWELEELTAWVERGVRHLRSNG